MNSNLSVEDIKQRLHAEFGNTLSGPRDEGLGKMAETLANAGYERSAVEATLAEMIDNNAIRYVAGEPGDVGAGVMGALDAPTGGLFGMSDGRPQHGAIAASQFSGTGYWDLTER